VSLQIEREVLVSRSFLEIAIQLTQDLDVDAVLEAIVGRAMEMTGADYGAAVTLDPDAVIERFLHRGLSPAEVDALPHLPEGRGLLGEVLHNKEAIMVHRIDQHHASVGFPSDHVPMDAFLGVPIAHQGNLIGALYLTKRPERPDFDEHDQELVQAMAALAAVGISNARSIDQERQRSGLLDMIRNISSKVTSLLDAEEVLSTTVEELGRAADVSRCYIRMVEAQGVTALGPIEHEFNAPGISPLAGEPDTHYPVASLAAMTRKTQWSDDVTTDERLTAAGAAGGVSDLLRHGTRAVIATPLEWADELLGVIVFHSQVPRRWSEQDVTLIEAAAREVSSSVHNARMYEDALETVEELQELEQRRADYISMVSHEIRSPMTVVAGIADILGKKRHRMSEENLTELISSLEREARRLARLVSEVLDLERIDRGGMNLVHSAVDLVALIGEAVEDTGESSRIEVRCEPAAAVVQVDRDKIKQVLINLISNAAKFSPDEAQITIGLDHSDGHYQIGVQDRGPGISEEDRQRLFKRFSRLTPTQAKPGSGLGLYLSRLIVERHGGRIWVESEVGAGTTFYFTVPPSPPAAT
jgi:signal transduction histidine kinase